MILKNVLLAGGFVVLAVVAALGWTKAERASTPAPLAVNYGQLASYGQPASYTNANPVPCTDNGAQYQTNGEPYPPNGATYQTMEYYPQDRYVQGIHRPVVVRRYEEQPRRNTTEVREVYVRHHGRSVKKSVAIVAGSAGVGAAGGALGRGGKGAGISALARGAGGVILDHLTHNHLTRLEAHTNRT